MAAVCRVAAVDHNAIQIVNLVLGLIIRVLAHWIVHVLLHVECGWVPHFSHDLSTGNIKSLNSSYKNSWRLVNSETFCRVLLLFTHWAQVLVIFCQLVYWAKLVKSLCKRALLLGFATWKWHVESKGFVKGVRFVVTRLAVYLRTQFSTKNLKNWSFALGLNHMQSRGSVFGWGVQNLF